MRLIDADALKEAVDNGWKPDMMVSELFEIIDEAPTIGGWITTWDNKRKKYVTNWMPLPEPPKEEADEHND